MITAIDVRRLNQRYFELTHRLSRQQLTEARELSTRSTMSLEQAAHVVKMRDLQGESMKGSMRMLPGIAMISALGHSIAQSVADTAGLPELRQASPSHTPQFTFQGYAAHRGFKTKDRSRLGSNRSQRSKNRRNRRARA